MSLQTCTWKGAQGFSNQQAHESSVIAGETLPVLVLRQDRDSEILLWAGAQVGCSCFDRIFNLNGALEIETRSRNFLSVQDLLQVRGTIFL